MEQSDIADSFGVREYPIRRVPLDAPWRWLALGWRDLWTVPQFSLLYGAFFVAVASIVLLGLQKFGAQSLMIVLSAGFLIIAPLLAVGLYEASRLIELREPLTLGKMLFVRTENPSQLAFLGVILALLFVFWVEIAFFIFAIAFGPQAFPPLDQFIPVLLLTWFGLGMLVVGSMAGAFLASIAFAISVVSIPLLMTRRVNTVTAIAASLQAVGENIKPLLLWGVMIAVLMFCGFTALLVGLAITFPLIGHASWHAFRELVADAPTRPTPEQMRPAPGGTLPRGPG